ncbi:unnamed protein product, partial [Rotaria socialis]
DMMGPNDDISNFAIEDDAYDELQTVINKTMKLKTKKDSISTEKVRIHSSCVRISDLVFGQFAHETLKSTVFLKELSKKTPYSFCSILCRGEQKIILDIHHVIYCV